MSTKTDRAKIEALAEKYTKREKYEDAILEYLKLITGDEQDIPIRNIIGDLYIKTRQVDQAVEEFKKVSDYYEKKGVYTKSIANRSDCIQIPTWGYLGQTFGSFADNFV